MDKASVSVVLPVYNGEKYLRECIESVLGQKVRPCEIIVVDDGSSDRTAAIAESFGDPVLLLRQTRTGPAGARNRGVAAASGDYLAFIDADDLWLTTKLALQLDWLKRHPETDILFGMMQYFYSPETDQSFQKRYACPQGIVPGIHPGTMLLSKDLFRQIGDFDATLKMGEFIEWRARATALKESVLSQLTMYRRIHPSNYGIAGKHNRKDYLTIARRLLSNANGKKLHGKS